MKINPTGCKICCLECTNEKFNKCEKQVVCFIIKLRCKDCVHLEEDDE